MGTSSAQDRSFASDMQEEIEVKTTALEVAITWIKDNLEPDDVFSEEQLKKWAIDNDYKKEE